MAVLKWSGLVVAIVGLVAVGLFGFGPTSYAFGSDVATNCGSVVLPKNPDDALCTDFRSDDAALFRASIVVSLVGLVTFFVARRRIIRSVGLQGEDANLSV